MTIQEVYEKYAHLDHLLSDPQWLADGGLQQGVLFDLWQTVKLAAQPVVAADALHQALAEAVSAIYFDDNSDYSKVLWSVVHALGGDEAAALLESDPKAAYDKYGVRG